ncbi:YoaK family protein [Streptosporangium sandarakinum]|uniref:YoaK family protein n=1 Tax=Streptosporangium TaxID=2000 RepID=UPI0031F86878
MTGDDTRGGGRADGPLPYVLVALAFTTGMIDAVSFLDLGQIFVAAMTGNVIILGLGLGLAGHGTPLPSALSLMSFAAGAAGGGRTILSWPGHRHRGLLLAAGTAVQTVLVCGASILASRYGFTDPRTRWPVIMMLAFSLGWEYAVVRGIRVSDLNTTVVTTTLTSLFAESVVPARQGRRLVSICALLAGALVSGTLRRLLFPAAPLWTAVLILTGCTLIAYVAARRPGAEHWR